MELVVVVVAVTAETLMFVLRFNLAENANNNNNNNNNDRLK